MEAYDGSARALSGRERDETENESNGTKLDETREDAEGALSRHRISLGVGLRILRDLRSLSGARGHRHQRRQFLARLGCRCDAHAFRFGIRPREAPDHGAPLAHRRSGSGNGGRNASLGTGGRRGDSCASSGQRRAYGARHGRSLRTVGTGLGSAGHRKLRSRHPGCFPYHARLRFGSPLLAKHRRHPGDRLFASRVGPYAAGHLSRYSTS